MCTTRHWEINGIVVSHKLFIELLRTSRTLSTLLVASATPRNINFEEHDNFTLYSLNNDKRMPSTI